MSAENNTTGQKQQMVSQFQPKIPGQCSTDLCDCFDDPSNCLMTICDPFITFGQNVEIIDKGKTAITTFWVYLVLHSVTLYLFRTKLREQFSRNEEPCSDCLVHCCSIQCDLRQEHRELKNLGLDPYYRRWAANVVKLNQNGRVSPAVEPGMTGK